VLFSFALSLTLLYLLLLFFFLLGLVRIKEDFQDTYQPTVSVVVAARNEEGKIHRSLNSLAQLDYPTSKLEIILVDDQSDDSTNEIMLDYAEHFPNFKVIQVKEELGGLRGKANAINLGIDHARGELVFLTDADCVVPRSWIRAMANQYKEDVGLVAGYTLLDTDGWFGGMQSLDWALLHTIAAGGVGLRKPLSCFGNNLTFRREAYEQVGGFRGVPFSVTEDFVLFTAITKRTKWNYTYSVTTKTLVWSLPCSTWQELFQQKRRWVVGGLGLGVKGFLILGVGFSVSVFLCFGPLFGLGLVSSGVLWGLKLMADAVFLSVPLKRLKALSLMRFFPAFEIYFIFYVLAIPFLMLTGRKVEWKGRKL